MTKNHVVAYRYRTIAQAWAGSEGTRWSRRYRYKWSAVLAAFIFNVTGAGRFYAYATYVGKA